MAKKKLERMDIDESVESLTEATHDLLLTNQYLNNPKGTVSEDLDEAEEGVVVGVKEKKTKAYSTNKGRITCSKSHFSDLSAKEITDLVNLFFKDFMAYADNEPNAKTYNKTELGKEFIDDSNKKSFMREGIKLLKAHPHFTKDKHSWLDFGYNIKYFIYDIGPRFFCNVDPLIKRIDRIPREEIIYWDTVLLSHSKNFALTADKSAIKLGSGFVEYFICFTNSSSALNHGKCARGQWEKIKASVKVKANLDDRKYGLVRSWLAKHPGHIWHLLLCLYETDCTVISTGNDLVNSALVKDLESALSTMKRRECKLKVISFTLGCSFANPIQHGAKYMMKKLQTAEPKRWEEKIPDSLPPISYMLQQADNYIKSHGAGKKTKFIDGYFAVFGEPTVSD